MCTVIIQSLILVLIWACRAVRVYVILCAFLALLCYTMIVQWPLLSRAFSRVDSCNSVCPRMLYTDFLALGATNFVGATQAVPLMLVLAPLDNELSRRRSAVPHSAIKVYNGL